MGSLVSLVMSDIVDSTRRWNAAEGAMAADLELHDRLIREVVEGAGGTVFKHTGDGMIAVFDDPVAAAGAAAGIQQAIGSAQWQQPDGLRVRAAVHTGVVYPRDGDLFGTAVNKVARLLGVCPPGAVLVSGATTGLLTDRAPEGMVLQPVGPVDLAGFATPDDAHALVGDGQQRVEVRGAAAPAESTLPAIHDELVGRADEVAAIWDALGRAPLVTLVGVGGMGKTRLALEVAAGAVAAYDGAVWWIDLANATTADAVVPVAMAAVDARDTPGRTALQSLCDRFTGVTGLVVVDNCEHVLAAARTMVDAVRTARPTMRVVCTSREALGLRGEQLVPVGSLPIDDSITLFSERAMAVRPDLDTTTDAAVIEQICTRLDGIPLAVELAAARCRSMTPAEIDTRLTDRFRLLRGGRDGAERHRTLQAAVAWSYELLDPDERAVFDQMAVFAGGTLIDGLTAVTGIDDYDLLDLVDRLVARSMVVATRTPLGTRYHQLETLRQFAEDRLMETGTIDATRDRHLTWTLDLAVQLVRAHGLDAEVAAFARFATDVDNLRVAVAHALATGRTDTAHTLVALVGGYAWWTPAWEVLDWVRPFPTGHQWTPLSTVCAALGAMADTQRGLHYPRALSVDDVPDWYEMGHLSARIGFIFNHLLSGGDPAVALQLLDRLEPATDAEGAAVDGQRLLVAGHRRMQSSVATIGPEEVDDLIDLATRAVALARRSGGAVDLVVVASNAADALVAHRPDLAEAYAREAVAIADRFGPRIFGAYAERVLLEAQCLQSQSAELLAVVRDRARAAVEKNQTFLAIATLWVAAPALAPREPRLVLEWTWITGRDMGRRFYGFLDETGLALPADLDEFGRSLAQVTLADVIRAMLAALDRLITEAESGASATGGGEG